MNLNLALAKQSEFEGKLSSVLMRYEKRITSSMKCNPKQFFAYLNSKRKVKGGVSELKDETGNLCSSPLDNANILGKFFASTFVQETDDIDFQSPETVSHIPTSASQNVNDIEDIEVDFDVVQGLLKDLNIYKSGGPDELHPKLLRTMSTNRNFVCAVVKLFSRCSETGRFRRSGKLLVSRHCTRRVLSVRLRIIVQSA